MISLNETQRRFCADVCGLKSQPADAMHRPEVVTEMREWLKDLDWMPQRYVERASNREVVRMVQDQYDGGVVGWYRDIEGIGPDVCHLCAAMGLHLDGCPDIG